MSGNKLPVVLIIDDEEIIRIGFKSYLEDCDYKVLEAENGRVGLEVYEKEKPDVVLLDLRMPEINGLDVLAKISETTPKTPVIIVSATDEIDNAIEALRRGAWDYLSKPISDMIVLGHAVEKALERADLIRDNLAHQEHLEEQIASRTKDLKRANKQLKQEINEHQQTEDALRKSEELFRNVYRTAPLALLVWDLDARVTDWNEKAENVFGWTKDEALNKNIFNFLILDSDRTNVEKIVEDLLKDEFSNHSINNNITKDGRIITCEWNNSPLHDNEGNVVGAISLALDITDRKRAEKALSESEAKYRALVQDANSIILRMDTDGRVTFFNEFALRFFGYAEAEIYGKNVIGTIVPKTDSAGRNLSAMILDIGIHPEDYSSNENENICRNGQRVWIAWTNKAIKNEKGNIEEILCVGNDITEHKQIEEKRRLAEQALKKREMELEEQTHSLEEANAALKVLLTHRDQDKKEFEEKILSNVKEMIFPYIEKLETSQLSNKQMVYLDIAKSHLKDIIAPFMHQLSSKYSDLTPSEIKVAGLVKDGKTTKEMAELLNLSIGAVNFHRNNLRKKLGLRNKRTNLRSHLLSLT